MGDSGRAQSLTKLRSSGSNTRGIRVAGLSKIVASLGLFACLAEGAQAAHESPAAPRVWSAVQGDVNLPAVESGAIGRGAFNVDLESAAQLNSSSVELPPSLNADLNPQTNPSAAQKSQGVDEQAAEIDRLKKYIKVLHGLIGLLGMFLLGILVPLGLHGFMSATFYLWLAVFDPLRKSK